MDLIGKVTASKMAGQRSSRPDTKYAEELMQKEESGDRDILEQDAELLEESFGIILEKKFSWEIAILYVEENGNFYHILALHANQNPLETRLENPPVPTPELSFSKYMEEGHKPSTIIGSVRRFSKSSSQVRAFRGWLIRLKERLTKIQKSDSLCLIIHDRTDFEIPWEMISLKNNDEILGASLPVVRWQDIPDPEIYDPQPCDSTIKLRVKHDDCCGDIHAYTNIKDFKYTKQEIEAIEAHFKVHRYVEIKDFLNKLERVKTNVSIVFIASHGYFGTDILKISFGEQKEENRQNLPELENYNWKFFKNSPGIVFMNCCHSGRLQKDKKYHLSDSNYRQGFAAFFLEKGAKGVIGTLEKISDEYAAKISKKFFEIHRACPSLSVAEILCSLRTEAVKNFNFQKNNESELFYFYTFMYVYYGNPMTMLKITPSGE